MSPVAISIYPPAVGKRGSKLKRKCGGEVILALHSLLLYTSSFMSVPFSFSNPESRKNRWRQEGGWRLGGPANLLPDDHSSVCLTDKPAQVCLLIGPQWLCHPHSSSTSRLIGWGDTANEPLTTVSLSGSQEKEAKSERKALLTCVCLLRYRNT